MQYVSTSSYSYDDLQYNKKKYEGVNGQKKKVRFLISITITIIYYFLVLLIYKVFIDKAIICNR